MRTVWERLGWTLATLSFALYFLLSIAHMIGLSGHVVSTATTKSRSSTAIAASTFSEVDLFAALAEICTGDGIAQRDATGKDGKPLSFPTCPICSLFAAVTLILVSGLLEFFLCRVELTWFRPLVTLRRLSGRVLTEARPRAPPSNWIAA